MSARPRLNTSVFDAAQDHDNKAGSAPAEPPVRAAADVDADAAIVPAPRQSARRGGQRAPQKPAQRPARRAGGLAGLASLPIPGSLDGGTTKPLNVRVPASVHFQMKLTAVALGLDMQEVVGALVTVFVHDPELFARLNARADEEGITFGELVHDALLDVGDDD